MRPSLLAALVVAAIALPTLGCKRLAEKAEEKAAEKAIEHGTGGQVQLNGDNKGGMKITTDAGTMTIGNNAQIPDDFPKAVAIYPGAKADLAARQSDAKGKAVWTLTMETPDSKDKVVGYYKSNMTGFTVTNTMDSGKLVMNTYDSPQYTVTMTISAESAKTVFQEMVAAK